jgi:hypothetical protein
MRAHRRAIRHFPAGKFPCVERCHADALAAAARAAGVITQISTTAMPISNIILNT